jgi:hypothetical protein
MLVWFELHSILHQHTLLPQAPPHPACSFCVILASFRNISLSLSAPQMIPTRTFRLPYRLLVPPRLDILIMLITHWLNALHNTRYIGLSHTISRVLQASPTGTTRAA